MKSVGLAVAILLYAAGAFGGSPVFLTIPSTSGTLAIDGRLDDAAWQQGRVLPLASDEFDAPFPAGGEARVATHGGHLCLSARVPEPGLVVAHCTGHSPNCWPEDLVIWNIRVQDTAVRRHLSLTLTVNVLGAYSLEGTGGVASLERSGPDGVMVSTRRSGGEWTVEAAIPLDRFGQIGFMDVQRVRAARPDAPELRWYWPGANERATFQFEKLSNAAAPTYSRAERPGGEPAAGQAVPELAWIPKNAWSEEQHSEMHVSRMFETTLRSSMAFFAAEEKRDWEKVTSRERWERFRDERIAALRKSLGPFPERTPLRANVTRRANYGDGFVIENVLFESRPHLLVSANLYLPENLPAKIPAIIVVHSHHAPKTQSELQDLGMTWARAGTAVLVMDQLCAGERSQSQPWPRESYYGRYALGNQLLLAGESLMKWMVWDLMRGVDLLLERPYIDASRIILLGAVAGGGDPAAVTAVLDPRIAGVIPFNFGEAGPEEHYTLGPREYASDTAWPGWGEWETTRCLPRSSSGQFFPWLLCAAVAPRPFVYSFEIGWPVDVEHEPAWDRYKKVFAFYGAGDHLDQVHGFGPFPGPGECTNVGSLLRERLYPILNRWFHVPIPAGEYHHPRPDSELMCLTPAAAAERSPVSASRIALELAHHRLAERGAEGVSLRGLRKALADRLGDIEPLQNPAVRQLWTKTQSQVRVEAMAIETDRGISLPVYLLKPAQAAAKRLPVVLAVTQGGKVQFLSESGEDVRTLLREGIEICLVDLRNSGEVARTQARGPGAMELSETQLMVGGTMMGAWLKDVRTVFRYLAKRPDIDGARIALWGESFARTNAEEFEFDQSEMQEPGPFRQHQAEPMGALLVLLTGLYEEHVAAIAARGGLVSLLSVLEDRFCHVPQDVIVPGMLEAADIADIVAAQGARPILVERSVDGRDRLVKAARLESEFSEALKGSRELLVRADSARPDLANWLARQCLR